MGMCLLARVGACASESPGATEAVAVRGGMWVLSTQWKAGLRSPPKCADQLHPDRAIQGTGSQALTSHPVDLHP